MSAAARTNRLYRHEERMALYSSNDTGLVILAFCVGRLAGVSLRLEKPANKRERRSGYTADNEGDSFSANPSSEC